MSELKKVIDFKSLLFIVINSIMGTGIFFLPALSAKIGGPSAIISWFIMACIAIYISTIFAELSSMSPTSGGIYDYCKRAYGKSTSFWIGWLTFLIGNITIAMLIIGALQYLVGPEKIWTNMGISALFIIFFNFLSYRGMKMSVKVLVLFSFLTLITIISLIIPGIFHFDSSHFTTFLGGNKLTILIVIFYISETFFGWESISFLAGEVKDGEKNVPKALVLGTIIIAIISLIFVLTSFGSIPLEIFGASEAPLTDLGILYYGQIGGLIFTFLVFFSIMGSVADWIVSSPRLIHALSKDKLFFKRFSSIHPKYDTPYQAIMLQGAISILMLFAGAGAYEKLLEMLVPLLLIMYSLVILSLFVLRIKEPNTPRPFKAPFGKAGSIAVVIFFMSLFYVWLAETHNAIYILMEIGLLIIIGYPIYYLMQMYHNPQAIMRSHSLIASFSLIFEGMFFPRFNRNIILKKLGHIKGKSVLEYGSGVGTMALLLADAIGKDGKLYCVELTKNETSIISNRLQKKGITNTTVIQDPEMLFEVNSEIPQVDSIVSVNVLSNLDNVKPILKKLNMKIKIGDKLVVMETDKFYDVIRNVDWLSNHELIKNEFKEAGFDVKIDTLQGNAWLYLFICGVKKRDL